MTRRSDSLNFLRQRVDIYPFIAKAHNYTIRPEEYCDADTASAVLMGERVWLFRTVEARDTFVRTVRGAVALEELSDK